MTEEEQELLAYLDQQLDSLPRCDAPDCRGVAKYRLISACHAIGPIFCVHHSLQVQAWKDQRDAQGAIWTCPDGHGAWPLSEALQLTLLEI